MFGGADPTAIDVFQQLRRAIISSGAEEFESWKWAAAVPHYSSRCSIRSRDLLPLLSNRTSRLVSL